MPHKRKQTFKGKIVEEKDFNYGRFRNQHRVRPGRDPKEPTLGPAGGEVQKTGARPGTAEFQRIHPNSVVFDNPEQREARGGFQPSARQQVKDTLPTTEELTKLAFARNQSGITPQTEEEKRLADEGPDGFSQEQQPQEPQSFLGFKRETGKGVLGGDFATARNLAVAAGYGVALGAVIVGGGALVGRLLATRGLSSRVIAQTARGARINQLKNFGSLGGQIGQKAVNTASAKTTISWLTKITSKMKNPTFAFGALTSTAGIQGWAEWARAEGIEGLDFAYRRAVEEGDWELATQIEESIEEATDPELIDQIIRHIPFANILVGTRLKTLGSRFSKLVTDVQMENERRNR